MIMSDRKPIGSYRLSIVTMPLTIAVCKQFTMQVFGENRGVVGAATTK